MKRALPCGDYGTTLDGRLVASVERTFLADLVSSLTGGKLRYAVAELAALPLPTASTCAHSEINQRHIRRVVGAGRRTGWVLARRGLRQTEPLDLGGDTFVPDLRICLFGPFRIMLDNRPVCMPVQRKTQELLALVLLAPHRNVRREVAVGRVWPSARPETSRKAVRQALWQIHQVADAAQPADQRLVLCEGAAIRLNPRRRIWLDVAAFTDVARVAQDRTVDALAPGDLDTLARASDLYCGPLLDGCYEDWCLAERAHLEDLHLNMLDKLSRGHERFGEFDQAIRWAQRLLEVEPAHERSHRRLMWLYYRTDDRTRALRQYRRCRWMLEHELGVQPSGRTLALAATIGADAAASAIEPVLADAVPPNGVEPVVASVGVGELRAELAALRASVEAMSTHLHNA